MLALELPLVAGRVAEELVAAVPAVDGAVAELGLVDAGAVAARPLGDGAVAVAGGAVGSHLVAPVAAVVVVVASPPVVVIQYRDSLKGLYVVARIFFPLLCN